MSNLKWVIGEVEVFQIAELEAGKLIQSIIKNATPENNKNILIDACNGNDKPRSDISEWGNLKTDFLKNLDEIDLTAEDVDIVVCTHMHCDHVGWNTKLENGVWIPTFQNAKYVFVRDEYDYWKQCPEKELADDNAGFDDSISPVVEAGLAEFVGMDRKIDKNISLMPTPGHTPGHVSINIESEGRRAIISGDLLHHPCQVANTGWMAWNTLDRKSTR